jgi:hypothetical protein
MTTNADDINYFCQQLAADPRYRPYADQIRTRLMDVDCRGDDCPDHAGFFDGLRWIFTREDHSLAERLEQMSRLANLKQGYQVVNLQEFTGWR